MRDDMSGAEKIDYHIRALKELFLQLQKDRNIPIKEITITDFGGIDYRDFLMQTIHLGGGKEKVLGNENRPFTDNELRYMLLENKFKGMLSDELKEDLDKLLK